MMTADLLASAGTPQAQEVLCRILDDPSVRALPEHGVLLQRLSFLWRPMPDTARFLLEEHAHALDEGDGPSRIIALYPMGTVAGRVAPVDPVIAIAMRNVLADELAAASDTETTVAALAGIGNTGATDEAEEILPYVADDAFEIRVQAASSLRYASSPDAVSALFKLVADADPMVAREAVSVLDHYRLDERGSKDLAVIVLVGAFNPRAAGKLVSALARRRDDDPIVREALVAMRDRSSDPEQRDRIDGLL